MGAFICSRKMLLITSDPLNTRNRKVIAKPKSKWYFVKVKQVLQISKCLHIFQNIWLKIVSMHKRHNLFNN